MKPLFPKHRRLSDDSCEPVVVHTRIVPPAAPVPKQSIPIVNAGAGRGAVQSLETIARFNAESSVFELHPTYVDPSPGKALSLAKRAAERGIATDIVEGKVQQVTDVQSSEARAPLIVQIDRPGEIAEVLRSTARTRRTTLVYLLIKRPGASVATVALYLRPGQDRQRELAARFFAKLAEVTLPRGSATVVGADAAPEDAANEALHRAWIAAHLRANLGKALAGIEGEASTFAYTEDGVETRSMFVCDSGGAWADARDIARQFIERPAEPIRRGESFMVVELAAEGLRFHAARLRKTDGRIAFAGSVLVDRAAVEAERARLERETLTRTNPALTTD